jgi:hypothetical protein
LKLNQEKFEKNQAGRQTAKSEGTIFQKKGTNKKKIGND